jgi:VWFA-related protein
VNRVILIPISLLAMLLCVQASLVSQPQEQPQSGDIIKLSTDLALVDALVTSQQTGRVIGNLQADDFQLYEDKVKQTITYFSQDRLPLVLVLAFDVLASARGGGMPERANGLLLKKELLEALQGLKPEDEVAVIAFHCAKVLLIEDFSRDRELITDRLVNIGEEFLRKASTRVDRENICIGTLSGSSSALNQAVYEAATMLNGHYRPGLRTAIIVASRMDKSLQLPFMGKSQKKVLEALLEPGTTVNGLVFPDIPRPHHIDSVTIDPVATPWGLLSRSSVSKYVEETGGDLVKIEGTDAGKKLGQAIEHLRARYSLGYLPTNEKWDGKYRRINLTVTPEVERREGKVIIQARKGYFAMKSTQARRKAVKEISRSQIP